jgi:hypothetical protein
MGFMLCFGRESESENMARCELAELGNTGKIIVRPAANGILVCPSCYTFGFIMKTFDFFNI